MRESLSLQPYPKKIGILRITRESCDKNIHARITLVLMFKNSIFRKQKRAKERNCQRPMVCEKGDLLDGSAVNLCALHFRV